MTSIMIAHAVLLAFAGYVAWGDAAVWRAWLGLFSHWVLSMAFVVGNPYGLFMYAFGLDLACAWLFYRYSPTIYGDLIGAAFAGRIGLAALAGLGFLSLERGLGMWALTYWNLAGWLWGLAVVVLIGAAYDPQRMANN